MEYISFISKNIGNLLVILNAPVKHKPKVVLRGEQRPCIWTIYYASMKYKYRKLQAGPTPPSSESRKGARHVHSGLLPSSNISFKSQLVSLQ